MAEDTSAYAINLAFQIQTATAIASLDEINQGVGTINASIEKISATFAGAFKTSITGAADEFAKIVESTGQISQSATAIDTAFAEALRTTTDQNLQLINVTKELEKQNLLTTKMRGWQKELGLLRDKETGKHKQHKKLGEEIAGVWDRTKKNVKDTILGFADMLIGLQAVKATFSAFMAEENKFITANYRLYGSQEHIIEQVNATTTAYGALRGRVLEAYVVLGESIRTNESELRELAQQNAAYSMALGVNQKDMGNWQRAMKSLGFGVNDAQIMLNRMTMTMRSMGMTAEQMRKQLNQQAQSAATMAITFGEAGTVQLQAFNTGLIGVANTLEMSAAQVGNMQDEINKAAADDSAARMFMTRTETMAGLSKKEWDAMNTSQQTAAKFTSGLNAAVTELAARWDTMDTETRAIQARAAGLGKISAEAMAAMVTIVKAHGSLANAAKFATKSYDEMRKVMTEAQIATFLQAEAENTLALKWDKALSDMDSAWKDLWVSLKPAMMWFINEVLKPIIHWLAEVVRWFSKVIPPVKETGDAVQDLSKKAEPALSTFEKIFRTVVGITGVFWLVSGAIIAVGGAIIGMYFLWKKFMATLNVMKLFALAVAATAVGIAFFLIAGAFATLAGLGEKIKLPFLVLVVILALVIGGLMLLSKAGPMVIVAALAIALVMVAVAFAAKLMAEAFAIAADSILKLQEISAWSLIGLGVALIVFGVLIGIAGVTIGIGGLALWIGSKPLSRAMANIGEALESVSPSALVAMGAALKAFGDAIETAGPAVRSGAWDLWRAPFGKACTALAYGIWVINIPDMIAVAGAMMILGKSLELMSKHDVSNLPDIAGKIIDFGDSLAGAGSGLRSAAFSIAFAFIPLAWAFQTLLWVIPVIDRVMTAIADAIQEGVDRINAKMRGMLSMLSPLELLMSSLGMPIRSLAMENVPGRVTAETVQTVRVKGDGVGGGSLERREATDMQERQISLLSSMNDKIDKITGGGDNTGDEVRKIRALLGEYLPKLSASPTKLGTKMNDWGV